MDSARLLIVDDDPALLEALTKALRLRMPQVAVDACDSGAAALARLADTDYDTLITDIKMPGMDGLSLLAEVRCLHAELPTLLITGHGQHDLAVQAIRGGAFDFIQKPVDRDYLVASLMRAIQVRQLARKVHDQRRQLEQHAAELERTVEARTAELREANQAKDRFLATLAHELRNPLAAIRTAIDVIHLCRADERSREQAQSVIETQVQHMVRVLDDLLDISRITQDRIVLQQKLVDLVGVVRYAVDSMRPTIDSLHHQCSLSLPDQPLPINGDTTRLHQVITNLLTNAAKYTEPHGEIWITLQQHDDQIVLEVRDTGIGIADDMLARVFEPFVQAENSLERSQGGLGIGLTLVRKLVELHGGSVTAASEGRSRGATFTVRLPVARELAPPPDEPPPDLDAPPLRILLVEDLPAVADMTEKLLTCCGHKVVHVAHDGPRALKAAANNTVDVILLDVGLPGMNGYDVARRLREQPLLEDVLLVAMTGYGQQEDRRRGQEAGFDHHLVKPVSLESLQRVLGNHSRLLQRRSLHKSRSVGS